MGPGWIVSSNLEKDVNVNGTFVFEIYLITFTLGVHLILFSNLTCNHLRADGTGTYFCRISFIETECFRVLHLSAPSLGDDLRSKSAIRSRGQNCFLFQRCFEGFKASYIV